jgi:hypothetical protein
VLGKPAGRDCRDPCRPRCHPGQLQRSIASTSTAGSPCAHARPRRCHVPVRGLRARFESRRSQGSPQATLPSRLLAPCSAEISLDSQAHERIIPSMQLGESGR